MGGCLRDYRVFPSCTANHCMDGRHFVSSLEYCLFWSGLLCDRCFVQPLHVDHHAHSTADSVNMKTYNIGFNANEWYVIVALIIGCVTIILLPKRFPKKVAFMFFMCGVYSGFFFDHSVSVEPVSFYDVNDRSKFEFMDFVSYWMYGPYAYVFFHIWDRWKLQLRMVPLYICCWTIINIGFEWLAVLCGVFHYRHGYKLAFSVPLYFITLSLWMVLYYVYRKQAQSPRVDMSMPEAQDQKD